MTTKKAKKAPEPKPEVKQTPKPEPTRGMLSKIRRAFIKAKLLIDEKAIESYAKELITAGIQIMDQKSTMIAKVLRRELDAKELR